LNKKALPDQTTREIFLPLGQGAVSKQWVQRLYSPFAQRRARATVLRGFHRSSEASAFGEGQGVVEVPAGLGSGWAVSERRFGGVLNSASAGARSLSGGEFLA